MFRRHTSCRSCGSKHLVKVFSFGHAMPLANDFKRDDESHEGFVPVEILFCESCQLAQTSVVVDPARLYSTYSYVTSTSRTMMDHFALLWDEIEKESKAKRIMEIGSNTGELLAYFLERGATSVMGVEPAINLAKIANERGVPTLHEMYGDSGFVIPKTKPHVIIARHVFCHVSSWKGFIASLEKDTGPETVVMIEVPWLADTLEKVEFDQFYLEHTSYLSIHAMEALLRDSQFQMHKVLRVPVHGGAVLIFLRKKESGITPDASVAEMLSKENITLKDWQIFNSKAHRRIDTLRMVIGCYLGSKKVVGFGASAKSCAWIMGCGFTKADIAFICDNTPQKQGRLSPGTDIPIVPESHLTRENADVVICFSWNFFAEIRAKLQPWIEAGGVLINPHEL